MDYYKNLSLEDIIYTDDNGVTCVEQWKDILDYEGLYQVSDIGRVKRLDRYKNHSSGKGTFLSKEKIMKQNKAGGYYCVSLYKNLIIKNWAVHHLVSIAFMNHYPMQNNLVIDHKNNIKEHNMLSNLQIITHRENSSKDKLNSVGFTGVCKTIYGFVALIKYKEKALNLGTYETPEEASKKYNEAVKLIDANKDIFHLVKTRSNMNSFTGVCKSKNKFQSRIIIDNKFVNLGIFDTAELAEIGRACVGKECE
jgi:hypothetical protein